MRKIHGLTLVIAVVIAGSASANPEALGTLFPLRAGITATGSGVCRLEVRSSVPDVYTAAPAGEYDLLLGYPDAAAPVYELERVRSTILAVPAGEIAMDELEPNPAYSPASRLSRSGGAQRFLLWGVLGLAVIVLIVVSLRAARQEAGRHGRGIE